MIFVKTELRASSIQGLGLFAAEPILAGMIVYRWDSKFSARFTPSEKNRLPRLAREFLERFGWRRADDSWCLSLDDSRFMNHSDEPNLLVFTNEACPCEARAARDISAGEELTEDYRRFDPDFDSYGAAWGKP